MLIVSMVIFGTIGIFRRNIDLSSSAIAMFRGFVGAGFLLLLTALKRQKIGWAAIRRNLLLLLVSGAAMGFNWILLFEAYNYTSVATATLCYYMAPVLMILASPLLLKEKLTARKILCVLLSVAGVVLVSGTPEAGGAAPGSGKGILLGLGAAVLYAAVILLNKRMKPIGAYDRTFMQLLTAAVVLLPYNLLTGGLTGMVFTPLTLGMLAAVCILHTGFAYGLYFGSIDFLPAQTLALFSYIDPVVAVLLSALLLREPMTGLAAVGAVLVLGSAVLGELPEKAKA